MSSQIVSLTSTFERVNNSTDGTADNCSLSEPARAALERALRPPEQSADPLLGQSGGQTS